MTTQQVILSAAARTDTGLVRSGNEDAILAGRPIYLVADGMGGHDAGDRASAAVVAAFEPLIGTAVSIDAVGAALEAAAQTVTALAAQTNRGAGSTVSGVALLEHEGAPHWLIFNVGDSRVYRHYENELTQITVDHSLGQEMIDAGSLRPEDLATFAKRNVITRAIGAADSPADSWLLPVTDGERLLICTDGLTGEVNDESIRATLTMCGRPESAVEALIQRAHRAGGRDNISAVVVDVLSGGNRMPVLTGPGSRFAAGDDAVGDSTIDGTTIPVPGRGHRG